MIINHNMTALNIYNNINQNNRINLKAMQRISSGLKINSAADDSAGSVISTGMKAQIIGLGQAQRNIQDGISIIQTAEGGLSQIENNLQRMRTLTVQAANGTLTSEDKKNIQNEIDEINRGIDDIAGNTEFNKIKLLSPPSAEGTQISASGKSDIIFIIDKTSSMSGTISNVKKNIDSFVGQLQSGSVDVRLGAVFYGDVNDGDAIIKKDFTNNIDTFKGYIDGIPVEGGGDTNESGLEGIKNGALTYPLREAASRMFILVTDAPVHDTSSDGDGGDGLSVYDIDDVANELKSDNIKLTVVGPVSGTTNTQLKRLSSPTGGSYLNISGDFSSELNTLADNIIEDSGAASKDEMPVLLLQIGANANDTFPIELFDAGTKNIGTENLSIDPPDEAQKSMAAVDEAIKIISGQRAKFGSYENVLGHTLNKISEYNMDLNAADSRIEDSDTAQDIMEMTKSNIILQSAESLLNQANKIPESILNLVKQSNQG